MKVLFITPAYYPNLEGGSERSLKIIAEGLAKEGIDVVVLSFDSKNGTINEKLNGVKVIRVKKKNFIINTISQNLSLLLYRKIVWAEKPDIIHVYNTWHIPSSTFFRKYAPVVATLNNYYPIIVTAYTEDNIIERGEIEFFRVLRSIAKTLKGNLVKRYVIASFYSIYSLPVRYYSKKINKYIVYADAIKEIYLKAGFDKKKFVTIQSPIDDNIKKKKIEREKNSVLYVGGPYEAKGFYELLEAAKILKKQKILFYFVGINRVPKKARDFVRDEDLNVKFIGRLEHEKLSKYYAKCSVLVHPSQWPEPFSRVWTEAILNDTPIISSDNPCAKEILKGYSLFYKRKNSEELAYKIEGFLSKKLKISGVKRVLKNNNYIIKGLIDFYKRL
jgi:glycosyltransferase involved in cell wall biosynthesis